MVFFFKVPFWNFATITRHFDNGIWNDTLQLKILQTSINIRTNSFFSKYISTKIDESAWKIIIYTTIWACYSKNIPPRYFTYYWLYVPFLSNKPSCFVPIFWLRFIYLFLLFDILCILKLIQSQHVLYNNQKKFWGCSMLFLLEGLQPQNVLIMLLFPMKQSYQSTKTTPNVNNSLWFTKITRNINHCYFSFLFEIPQQDVLNWISFIAKFQHRFFWKIVLVKRVYSEIDYKSFKGLT